MEETNKPRGEISFINFNFFCTETKIYKIQERKWM